MITEERYKETQISANRALSRPCIVLVPVNVLSYIHSLSAFQIAFNDVHVAVKGWYHDVKTLGLWTRILDIFLVL